MKDINKYQISQISTIREAIKKLDEGGIGFITCVDENEKVVGVVRSVDVFHELAHIIL